MENVVRKSVNSWIIDFVQITDNFFFEILIGYRRIYLKKTCQ